VIIGLGNPGIKYRLTRHNIGFMAIDEFSNGLNLEFKQVKSYNSMIARGKYNDDRILLAKPQTYMNLSGIAVKKIMSYYKIPTNHLLIVYDDINLEFEQIRIRKKGSSGGHNGMKSIIECLGSENIPRIRIGIGNRCTERNIQYSDYVLSKFTEREHKDIKNLMTRTSSAINSVIMDGFDKAMREYNRKPD